MKLDHFTYFNHLIRSTTRRRGVFIVMHGKGDSARPFRKIGEELGLHEFDFVLMQARRSFLDGYSWYGEPPHWGPAILRVRGEIFKLIDHLIHVEHFLPHQIFLLGFSQGCLVATDVALNYPYTLGGVIGVSGYFYFPPGWRLKIQGPGLKTPWLLTHGHRDDVLPLNETKFGMLKLKHLGLPITWIESNKAHTFEDEEYPLMRRWVRNQLRQWSEKNRNPFVSGRR